MTNCKDLHFKKLELAKIYNVQDDHDLELILERLLTDQVQVEEEQVSFIEAYTSKKYRYGHLNALVIAMAS